ncbi:MAG: hypothetical protein Q9191_002246 [Dirinaria sp. TL-2023a]
MIHGQRPAEKRSQRHSNHDRVANQQTISDKNSPFKQQSQRSASQHQISNAPAAPSARHHPLQKRKRKSEQKPDSRPATRRRTEGPLSEPLKDEAYIRETMHIPKPGDYPFLDGNSSSVKGQLYNALDSMAKIHTEYSVVGNDGIRCTLTCTFSGSDLTEIVFGEDKQSKKSAERAAWLHLLAKLHQTGQLSSMSEPKDIAIDQETMIAEADAKLDIYNYAARFDAIPEITLRVSQVRARRKTKKLIEVGVALAEQNIKVNGRGTDLRTAEIAAALKFKQAAEEYQAAQGSETIVIKDSTALTTTNAKDFFDFYKIMHPRARVVVESQEVSEWNLSGSRPFRAQVSIDGKPYGQAVEMNNKKRAEALAHLTAALEVKALEVDLYPKFLKANKSTSGAILKPMAPFDMPVDEDCLLCMRQTLLDARNSGLPDEAEELLSDENIDQRRTGYGRRITDAQVEYLNQRLQSDYRDYLQNPRLEEIRQKRSQLPMNQQKGHVLKMVDSHPYSIVIGATGSGKTTQIPQILLEDAVSQGQGGACNIVCTQPRRIAASSVSRRVAEERGEALTKTVGYHVRFDAKVPPPGGSIVYCTTGILLQQLQLFPDEVMELNSHLVIDEVHERDVLIDFLLIIVKKVIARRLAEGKRVPKVVLMSATMDTELFASYFSNAAEQNECPTLSVPGRTFPVREIYLEGLLDDLQTSYSPTDIQLLRLDRATSDYLSLDQGFRRLNPPKGDGTKTITERPDDFVIDWKHERKVSAEGEAMISNEKEDALVPIGLVAITVSHIVKTSNDGAILVFLPGLDEIVQVEKLLRANLPLGVDFNVESAFKIFMLHSSMPAGQSEVFDPVPKGCRKIILSTNIAETSVTIPDVQHVIDTGKLREKRYDQLRRITKLDCTWISKSNSKQRAGRAGRVQNGNYYALFSKSRYESLRAIGLPEMLRTDLQETCLDVKAQAFQSPLREFLAAAIEPPAPSAVESSIKNLQALDALTDEEQITPLGRLLAALPVHPSLGKMIVLGIIFRCFDPMLVLGAAAAERNLFINPLEARREAQAAKLSFVDGSGSDHIAILNAVRQMRLVRSERNEYYMRDFAYQNYIHAGAFNTIENTAKQIEEILVEAGLIPFTPRHARVRDECGDPSLNENSHSVPLIKALVLAGVHPNLAVNNGGRSFRTPLEPYCIIHPSSINGMPGGKRTKDGIERGSLFSYSTMAKSNDGNSLFLRETSAVTPLIAALFGGKLRGGGRSPFILEIDRWLSFYVQPRSPHATKTIVEFRKAMERLFAGTFRDLAAKRRERKLGLETKGLADEEVRRIFAEGLVEILQRDVPAEDAVARRGLGARSWSADMFAENADQSWRPNVAAAAARVRGRRNHAGSQGRAGEAVPRELTHEWLLGGKY